MNISDTLPKKKKRNYEYMCYKCGGGEEHFTSEFDGYVDCKKCSMAMPFKALDGHGEARKVYTGEPAAECGKCGWKIWDEKDIWRDMITGRFLCEDCANKNTIFKNK